MEEKKYFCQNCRTMVNYDPLSEDEEEDILCEPCWVAREQIERISEVKTEMNNLVNIITQWEMEEGPDLNVDEIFNSLILQTGSTVPEALAGLTGFMLLNRETLITLHNKDIESENNY